MSRDGKIYLFAGNGSQGCLTGDGGPAKNAGLGTVQALAAAPDGALLIASYDNDNDTEQIRRVTPDGSKIETIAGTTNRQAPLGDGKPAMEAHIGVVNDMTVAPDGTIYWTERYSQIGNWKGRLRKLAPDGIVTTVAGDGDLRRAGRQPGLRRRDRRPTRRASRSATTARSTSRCSTRRRSSASTRPAASTASRARASRTSAARS